MSDYSCGHKVKGGLCPICVQEDIDKRHNEKLELLEQLTQAQKQIDKLESALNEIILITPIDALNLPPDTRMKMIAREALQGEE